MIISSEIKFDQSWSILIHLGHIWFNLIKKMKIWWYFSMIFSSEIENVELNIWWYISVIVSSEIQFDQVWSILIHSGQIWLNLIINKKVENLMIYSNDYFIRNQIWSSFIHFDPFWTDLIQPDQKKKEIENLLIYFNDYIIRNWKCGKNGKFGNPLREKHFKSFR